MAGIVADSAAVCMARFMGASVDLAESLSCDIAIAVLMPAMDNAHAKSNHVMHHMQPFFFIDVPLSFDIVDSA